MTCAAEKQSAKNNNLKHISKAELGCNLQLDTGGRSACFKFYMSIFPNCNNIPTNVTTPAVSEFHSCVHNGLFVDMVKTDQVAVSVHDRFFNGKLTGTSSLKFLGFWLHSTSPSLICMYQPPPPSPPGIFHFYSCTRDK